MTVHFLIGRSGSGKTTKIWETVSSRLEAEPLGAPMIVLVPEQGSFGAEQGLLKTGKTKGSIRAQTLSFSRLAYRVKQETGGSASLPISEEGKKMLIYKIISRRKEELKLFGASSDRPGGPRPIGSSSKFRPCASCRSPCGEPYASDSVTRARRISGPPTGSSGVAQPTASNPATS